MAYLRVPMAVPRKIPEQRPGKVGGKRDANRKLRAEALGRAGLELFLARGIEDVTIDEIAERAGTAKGNFYRYFEGKAELVAVLLEPVAERFRGAMQRCGQDLAKARSKDEVYASYTTLAAQLAMVTIEHREEVRLFLQENRAPVTPARASVRALVEEIRDSACELSEAAQRHGVIDVVDPRVSGLAVVGAIEYLGLEVLRGERGLDPATIATVLIRMVLDGVRRRDA